MAAGALRVACYILELTGPCALGVALGQQVLSIECLDAQWRRRAIDADVLTL